MLGIIAEIWPKMEALLASKTQGGMSPKLSRGKGGTAGGGVICLQRHDGHPEGKTLSRRNKGKTSTGSGGAELNGEGLHSSSFVGLALTLPRRGFFGGGNEEPRQDCGARKISRAVPSGPKYHEKKKEGPAILHGERGQASRKGGEWQASFRKSKADESFERGAGIGSCICTTKRAIIDWEGKERIGTIGWHSAKG